MNNSLRRFIQKHLEITQLRSISKLNKNETILELGCGSGYGTQLINIYFHPKKIVATDLDKKMITIAEKKTNSKMTFQVADATKLPFRAKVFDAVIEFGIIHHIPNWRDSLKEMYRVLKPGGELLLEDFSIERFNTSFGKILKKLLDHPYEKMYTEKQFISELKNVGFKNIVVQQYNPLLSFPYFVISAEK